MRNKLAQVGQVVVQVGGASGVTLAVAGASGAAISAATVIAATAGGAAVMLVGWGVYKLLAPRATTKPSTDIE